MENKVAIAIFIMALLLVLGMLIYIHYRFQQFKQIQIDTSKMLDRSTQFLSQEDLVNVLPRTGLAQEISFQYQELSKLHDELELLRQKVHDKSSWKTMSTNSRPERPSKHPVVRENNKPQERREQAQQRQPGQQRPSAQQPPLAFADARTADARSRSDFTPLAIPANVHNVNSVNRSAPGQEQIKDHGIPAKLKPKVSGTGQEHSTKTATAEERERQLQELIEATSFDPDMIEPQPKRTSSKKKPAQLIRMSQGQQVKKPQDDINDVTIDIVPGQPQQQSNTSDDVRDVHANPAYYSFPQQPQAPDSGTETESPSLSPRQSNLNFNFAQDVEKSQ